MLNITRMEELIKSKGWSNTYFCKQMGHSKAWISDMKRGIGLPDKNALMAIADKLNTTAEYLTDKTNQKNKPSAEAESLSNIEKEILQIYANLPEEKQKAFMTVVRALESQSKDK